MRNAENIALAMEKVLELHQEKNWTMAELLTQLLLAVQMVMKGRSPSYVALVLEYMGGIEIKKPGRPKKSPELPPPIYVMHSPEQIPVEPIQVYIPEGNYTVGQYTQRPGNMYKTDRDQVAIIRAMYVKLMEKHLDLCDVIEQQLFEGLDCTELLIMKFEMQSQIRSLDGRVQRMCTEYAK